jgi:hypothetical protein
MGTLLILLECKMETLLILSEFVRPMRSQARTRDAAAVEGGIFVGSCSTVGWGISFCGNCDSIGELPFPRHV